MAAHLHTTNNVKNRAQKAVLAPKKYTQNGHQSETRRILIDGYIRKTQKKLKNQIIPTEINIICFQFFNLIIDSLILNDEEQTSLFSLLNSSNKCLGYKYKLLFRGSRDGFKSDNFHKICDNIPNTLCIIHTDTDNIFGGYTTIPWKDHGAYVTDENAFLILLRSSKQYKPQIFEIKKDKTPWAVDHMRHYMCIFGSGYDLFVNSDCNQTNSSYTNAISYQIPSPNYLNGDLENFRVQEIEVFIVQLC